MSGAMKVSDKMAADAGFHLVLLLFLGLAALVYSAANISGWIIHHHDMSVIMEQSWLNAEYRNCKGYHAIQILYCGGDYTAKDTHVMPVRFHGRIDRTENHVDWRCQRNDKGVECWALD